MGFTVERYDKRIALGSFLSVKESISELGNFSFPLDCEVQYYVGKSMLLLSILRQVRLSLISYTLSWI